MLFRTIAATAMAATLLVGAADANAAILKQGVRGKLAAADAESGAQGRFRILIRDRGERHWESLLVAARGLDTTADEEGARPEYHAYLIDSEAAETDMGALRLRRGGRAVLRFNTRRDALPDGVESLADFGGGTIEVRLGDEVVLSGDVPEFLGVGDGNEEGSGAAAKGHASSRLTPLDEEGRGRGFVTASIRNLPRGVDERIVVEIIRTGDRGDTFSVTLNPEVGPETLLGEIRLRGRLGVGRLVLSTVRGDALPDSVLELGGTPVEVRDAEGTVVLSGTFPGF